VRGEGKIRAGVRDGVGYNSEGRKKGGGAVLSAYTPPEFAFGLDPARRKFWHAARGGSGAGCLVPSF
jgi:hypothetical protein